MPSPFPYHALPAALRQVATQNGLAWVGEALAALPEDSATAADRQRFMAACQMVVAEGIAVNDEKVLQGAVDELSELCRRNRRAQQAAQRALLPPELHGIIA